MIWAACFLKTFDRHDPTDQEDSAWEANVRKSIASTLPSGG